MFNLHNYIDTRMLCYDFNLLNVVSFYNNLFFLAALSMFHVSSTVLVQ